MTELDLIQQIDELDQLEAVSPKLEIFRKPIKIKGARGGRGAGAKSWSMVSLIVQKAEHGKIRVICLREIHKSLAESAYYLFHKTVERLRYKGWKFTDEYIQAPNGSYFIFRGLKDLRAGNQIKGLEDFDIFFVEEAADISMESWDILLPTLVRKTGAELWFCYNPQSEFDPVTLKIWNRNRDDAICIELKPGKEDNPWWNEGLQKEMELDFAFDPDLAEHIWNGQPRKQGDKCVMSRVAVRRCVDRIADDTGGEQVGIDVARFGDDKTEIWHRKGMKVINHKTLIKVDTQTVARVAWDMVQRRNAIQMLVDDTGVGGGVTDKLRDLGANVRGINFGGSPHDKNKYTTVADELWFEFPINEAQIPDDPELIQELSGRQYGYDNKNRRKIEPKADFKKRTGRSPDKADALLLCFYTAGGLSIPSDDAKALASRQRR